MYFVYVLRSTKNENLYVGFTTNLKQRLVMHNYGGVSSTKNRGPWELIFFEGYINKADALRREEYFKTTVGKRTIKLMLKNTFEENIVQAWKG